MATVRGMKLRSRGRLEAGVSLTVRMCKIKGRCVYASQKINKGELFLRYDGKLLTEEPETEDDRYIFEFPFKGKTFWMDGTEEDGSFGRLINDSVDAPNCKVKVKEENQKPSLYFLALRDIEEGEEILYNYGAGDYPWRPEKKKKGEIEECPVTISDSPAMDTRQQTPGLRAWPPVDGGKPRAFPERGPAPTTPSSLGPAPQAKDYMRTVKDLPSSERTAAPSEQITDTHTVENFTYKGKDGQETSDKRVEGEFNVDAATISRKRKLSETDGNQLEFGGKKILGDKTENMDDFVANTAQNKSGEETSVVIDDDSEGTNTETSQWNRDKTQALSSIDNKRLPTIKDADEQRSSRPPVPSEKTMLESTDIGLDDMFTAVPLKSVINASQPSSTIIFPTVSSSSVTQGNIIQPIHRKGHDLGEHGYLDPQTGMFYMDNKNGSDIVTKEVVVMKSGGSSSSRVDSSKNYDLLSSSLAQAQINHDPFQFIDESEKQSAKVVEAETVVQPTETNVIDSPCIGPECGSYHGPDIDEYETDMETGSDEDIEIDDSVKDSDYSPESQSDLDETKGSSDVPDSEPEDDALSDIIAPLTSIQNMLKPADNLNNLTNTDQLSSGREDDDFNVQKSLNSKDQRVWDKIHVCLYCGTTSTNISKHYLGTHKNEEDVKKILCLQKKSKQRTLELERLRNAGDYMHNMEVLRSRKGMLVTYTRRKGTTVDDYLPCEDCLGFFLKDSLWRHRKTCHFKSSKCEAKFSKIQSSAKLLLPSSFGVSEGLKDKIIKRMANDEVSICARNDSIIIKIGENLYQKNGQHGHMAHFISQKMREMARFLIVARKVDQSIRHLDDVIDPGKFRVVMEATKILCGYDESTHRYSNPSLALKIGHQLKKCARIKKSESLMNKSAGKEDADNFLSLVESEWTNNISSNALQCITDNKMNKQQMLPLTEDIKKLSEYLEECAEQCVSNLSLDFNKKDWDSLNKATLTRLVLFNRKRGGEVERIKVENYHARQTNNKPMPEIQSSLSPVEQMLCERFGRVEIRGKKGRTVAVLLTPEMQKSIDLLLEYRENAGVNPNNKFVFARSNDNSLNAIRMADTLRTYRSTLNLKSGECLTSTKLRKHVATVSQVLNLSRLDLEVMADFLGHDIDVHRSFYRLPQSTIQVAKMGKLLTAFNNGTISKYSGLTLDEIALDEELSSDSEEGEDDDKDVGDHEDEEDGLFPEDNEAPKDPAYKSQQKNKSKQTKLRLTEEQSRLLSNLFKANIAMRRELRMIDCVNVIKKYKCLNSLTWKKIKNTVHNWITTEKRKVKKM